MPNHLHLEEILKLMKKALKDKGVKILEEPYFIQDNLLSSKRSKDNKGNDLIFNVSSMFKGETPDGNISIFQVSTKVESYESDWYVDNQAYFDVDVVTFPTKNPTEFEVVDMLQEAMSIFNKKYNNISMDYFLRIDPDRERFGTLSNKFSAMFVAGHLDGFEGLYLYTIHDSEGKFAVQNFNEFNLIVEYDHYMYVRLSNRVDGYEFWPLCLSGDTKEGLAFKETINQFNFDFARDFNFITFITHYVFYKNDDFAIIYHDGEYYFLPREYSTIPIENVEKFSEYQAPKLNVPCEIDTIIPISFTSDRKRGYFVPKTPYHTQEYSDNAINVTECIYAASSEYDECLFANPNYKEYIIKYKNGTQSILQVNKEEVKDNNSNGTSRTNTRFKHIRY